jgi:hypothetical protein
MGTVDLNKNSIDYVKQPSMMFLFHNQNIPMEIKKIGKKINKILIIDFLKKSLIKYLEEENQMKKFINKKSSGELCFDSTF